MQAKDFQMLLRGDAPAMARCSICAPEESDALARLVPHPRDRARGHRQRARASEKTLRAVVDDAQPEVLISRAMLDAR
jgi:hypothetical protein